MHINLPKDRVAGVNESVRRARGNDNNAARLNLALFISDRDCGVTFDGKCDFDVGMLMQRRALPGLGRDDVGGERCALSFADELMRHSDERQLFETCKAHVANLYRARPMNIFVCVKRVAFALSPGSLFFVALTSESRSPSIGPG